MNYGELQSEIGRLDEKRKSLREHRAQSEVEAAINALLARSVITNQRMQGTVRSISHDCQRTDARTVELCAKVSELRGELAVANEEHDLSARLVMLSEELRQLRERGGARAADPQAELLARLSGGSLAAHDIGPALSVLLAIMIELVSAFGLAVLSASAEATNRAKDTNEKGGAVIDYLAERVEPAAERSALPASDLYADYQAWCLQHQRVALSLPGFVSALDRAREENGLRQIRKRKDRYYGIRIAAS
jgi:hypothetical protein